MILEDLNFQHCSKMKIAILIILMCLTFGVKAQKVYSVQYDYQADIKVFVTQYDYQADLLVYKVKYDYQAKENRGLWYFTEYDYQSDKKIFFTDYDYQADLKIYFVEYDYQAKWKNMNKMHLLY